MTYTLVFSPRAEGQVIRAAADFEDNLENLGHEFLEAVRETSKVVEGNPRLYQVKFDEFRSTKIKHHKAKNDLGKNEPLISSWSIRLLMLK